MYFDVSVASCTGVPKLSREACAVFVVATVGLPDAPVIVMVVSPSPVEIGEGAEAVIDVSARVANSCGFHT